MNYVSLDDLSGFSATGYKTIARFAPPGGT
jgi:hypothetical protein